MLKSSAVILGVALCAPPATRAQDTQTLDGCATLRGARVALDTLALEVRADSACARLNIELVGPSRVSLPRLRAGKNGDWVEVGLRIVNRSADTLREPLYLYADDNLRGTVGGRPIVSWRMRALVILHTTYADLWNHARGDLPPPSPGNNQRLHLLTGASLPGSGSIVDTLRLNVMADAETFDMNLTVRARRSGSVTPSPPAAKSPPPTGPPTSTHAPEPFIGIHPVPTDSGRAAEDSAIRHFVAELRLPSVHAVRDLLFLKTQDLLFFGVIYGSPMDVYAGVVGVRHRKRIGLLLKTSEHPWQVRDTTRAFPRFTLRRDDMTLADARVLDTLEALPQTNLIAVVLPVLVDDPLVPSAVLRRCVRRIYRNAGACSGPEVAAAAGRIEDTGTLTQLALLSGKWGGEGEAIQRARRELRRLAPLILADPHPPRATRIALAQAVAASPPDTAVLARLSMHPAVRRDVGLLALLADDRPAVLRVLIDLLPDRDRVRAPIASLFDPRRIADREAIVALLADPKLGRDPTILEAIANAPPRAFPAASGEAARRLRRVTGRLGAYVDEPPAVP